MAMVEEIRKAIAENDRIDLHHTFIKDCLDILSDKTADAEERRATLSIVLSILKMHLY